MSTRKGRYQRILSEEELAALTHGLAGSRRAVLVVSPIVADREILGRAFEAEGYRVISSGSVSRVGSLPEDTVVSAAVLAGEVLKQDKGAVDRLRSHEEGLPVYVIWEDFRVQPPYIPPPSGVWARNSLAECVGMYFAPKEAPSRSGMKPEPPGEKTGQEKPLAGPEGQAAAGDQHFPLSKDDYTRFLQALLQPEDGVEEILESSLRCLSDLLNPVAAAGLVSCGGFSLKIVSSKPAARLAAGKWVLNSGLKLEKEKEFRRLRPNAFAAVDMVPLVYGDQVLGHLFFFWRREDAPVEAEEIARPLAGRIWELLGRKEKESLYLPVGEMFEWVAEKQNEDRVLLLAAPLFEERLEAVLSENERWTREPSGAVLCSLLAKGVSPEALSEDLLSQLGRDLTGFLVPSKNLAQPRRWVREHAQALAGLRQAGRKGIFCVGDK